MMRLLGPLTQPHGFVMCFVCSPKENGLTNAIIMALAETHFSSLSRPRICFVIITIFNQENHSRVFRFLPGTRDPIGLKRRCPTSFSITSSTWMISP